MAQARLRAAFYRGGTSKAVVFNGADLPQGKELRDRIFLHVLGSPDPYGRQLDGMGGGLSSLSKVVIVEPSTRSDADVDYTFVQIAVKEPVADYGSACGNMSSCVGPFAVDEGLVPINPTNKKAFVRIHNTNTGQIYHARFAVQDGRAVEQGDFRIPGVAQSGSHVSLDFLDPGGAATGRLLPSGAPVDRIEVPGIGALDVSLVDAANPVVFVRATDMGCTGAETPQDLDANADLMGRMDAVRRAGAVAMGMAETARDAKLSNPKVAMIAAPGNFVALDNSPYDAQTHDIAVRLISMGNVHRAVTLTGAMCVAVAAGIPGTLVAEMAMRSGDMLRIGNPSGVLPVSAKVAIGATGPKAVSASTFRTQRRIMEGNVLYPASLNEITQ